MAGFLPGLDPTDPLSGIGGYNSLASTDYGSLPGGQADPSISPLGTIPGVGAGGIGGTGGFFGNGVGLGANLDTVKLGVGGLQTIAGLWGAFNAASLAKKQFNFQKQSYQTNLANQMKSYNTHLDDTERSRAVVEGQTPDQEASYLAANRLTGS